MHAAYNQLFAAFTEASSAYAMLADRAQLSSDRDLSRDPDYQRLHRSGMTIARLGGGEAIRAAIDVLATDAPNHRLAVMDMRRYWAGMDNW